jgi:uncharacterized repeat protein (TIGR02543 family)
VKKYYVNMKEEIRLKKRILTMLLTLLMMFGMFPATTFAYVDGQAYDFADMPNNWSTAALKRAVDNGLLKGYVVEGKTLINADAPLKRAEMAAVVNRAFGAEKTAELKGVTDVPSTAWYASDMAKAVMMGAFVKDAKMRPESNITRQEAFVVLSRAFKTISADTDLKALDNFTDNADISTWAQKDLNAMAAAGCINGTPDGKLNPKANITRAEFATVMDNLVKQYIDKSGEVTDVAPSGNVLVRVSGVTLKNITVKGDLIIADGVGEGDVTLDSVKVEGRTVIRGGGENSIIIKGSSDLGKVIVCKVDGKVRISVEDGADVGFIHIDDGSDDVLVEGIIGTLEVAGDNITAIAIKAILMNAVISGDNSTIVLKTESTLKEGTVSGNSSGIIVDKGATADKITVSGSNVKVEGSGTVKNVEVKAGGDNTSITTPNTKIETEEGAEGITAAGGAPIESGASATNNNAGTWIVIPVATGGSGGSSPAKVSAINIATKDADTGDVIDVSGGVENDAVVEVTLTTATTGVEIYYTTDGSTPTESSTKYTAPFNVDTDNTEGETVTIKAIGIKAGYTNSAVAEKGIVFNPISISTGFIGYSSSEGLTGQFLRVTIFGTTYASDSAVQNLENWTIDTGTTNFKADSITKINDKEADLFFTLKTAGQGTGRGTISVQAKAAAVTSGVDTNIAKAVMYESVFYTKTGDVTDINPATVEFLSGNQFWVPIAPEEIAVSEFTFKDNGVDKKASFDGSGWNVEKDVSVAAIRVSSNPAKITYYEGESLALAGLQVELTYSDDSTENVALANFAAKGITTDPVDGTTLSITEHNDKRIVVSCNGKSAESNDKLKVMTRSAVNIANVAGVTPPVSGETPVTAIVENEQYTGTVSWNPNHNPFQEDIEYTATITLTPKAGYTLTGVTENFFTVTGATTVTNAVNSGIITAVFPATASSPDFAGGAGTEANPYRIATAEQLNNVRNHLDRCYILTDNIDLSVYENWVPIGNVYASQFYGSFDGNGHTISNLRITSPNSLRMFGLFGYVTDATIENVQIKDAYVVPSHSYEQQVGILAGYTARTTISNCSTSGTVRGSATYMSAFHVGGLVGQIVDGTVVDACHSRADVTGWDGGSGLINDAQPGTTIKNSYSSGTVSNGAGFVRSIFGTVENCYTIATVNYGNLFASYISNGGEVAGCYYQNVAEGPAPVGSGSDAGIIGADDAAMKNQTTFTGWDFVNIWDIDPGKNDGYPFLRWQGYELISTYTVTYDGNGSTDGSVPLDAGVYNPNKTVTVLGNTGNLAKDGYTFDGWNTESDGKGMTYQADSTFNITANTTLYAIWKSSAANLISVAGKADNSPGGGTGEDSDVAITWSIEVNNEKDTLALADIVVEDKGTFEMYADEYYTIIIEEANPLSLNVGNTTAYIRIDAEDKTTIKFYEVTVKRALPAQSGSSEFTAGTPATYGTQLTVGPGTLTTTTNLKYWWYCSYDNVYDAYDSPVFGVSTINYTPVAADIGYYLIVIAVTGDASGSGILVTDTPVAKANSPAFSAEYAGTFSVEATSISLTGLGASAAGLEAAVAIDGINYATYSNLVVDGDGKATITGLENVTTSTKVKVRVKETATHKAGADKEITVTEEVIVPIEPQGTLLHAAAGSDFTGVVYKDKNDSKIYYNEVGTDGVWGTKTEVENAGEDIRLAIDGDDNPHVAYTTGGKIGYRKYGGSAWTDEVLIESNNAGGTGSCSKPDIAVDGSRKAHITYTDTNGYHVSKDENRDDIMYANNTSGSFVKQVIFDGWYDYPSGSNYYYDYYNWGSQIALDSNGDYYIIARNQSRYGAADTMSYSVKAKFESGSGGTEGNKTDYYATYDLTSSGSKVIALYGHSGSKTSELTVSGTTISFSNTHALPGGTVSSVATYGTDRVVGGVISGKLQTFYNGTATVYDDTVKNGTKVSVVYVGGNFYAIYTDNSDSIKMVEIGTP